MPPRTLRSQSPWPSYYVGQRVRCRFLLIKQVWQPFGLTTPIYNEPWLRSSPDGPVIEASFEAVLTDRRTVTWVSEACRFWQWPIIDPVQRYVTSPVFEEMCLLQTPLGIGNTSDPGWIIRRMEAEEKVAHCIWRGDNGLREQAFAKARELILTGRVIGAWQRHGNCSQPYRFRPAHLLGPF